MIDLSVNYVGIDLKNPVVISSSPLGGKLETIQRLEDCGAGAIVLPSLFEEQVDLEEVSHFLLYEKNGYRKYLDYYFDVIKDQMLPEQYMEYIRKVKERAKIPVIASLNGISTGGWINNAILMEEAGADALELNLYFIPTNPSISGQKVEEHYLKLVDEITGSISIPVAVKIHPYLSSIPNMVKSFKEAGADAVVLFNRFYQPDIHLEKMTVEPRLSLSTSDELLLRIRWTAILFGRVDLDIAVTGGVHQAEDLIKSILAGASVTMIASSLLQRGPGYLKVLLDEVEAWMKVHQIQSIQQVLGSMSQKSVSEPALFERANYLKVLKSYELKNE